MNASGDSLSGSDDKLFDVLNDEYKNVVNEFALAVFGVGALFFAVGSVQTPRLKQLIDLIGFGASLIMWIHMHVASLDVGALRDGLKTTSNRFMERYDEIYSWRYQGRHRCMYLPVTRLMTYFMGLVALAWLELALNGLGPGFEIGFPLERFPLFMAVNVDALLLTLMLTLIRRHDDIRKHREDVVRKQMRSLEANKK